MALSSTIYKIRLDVADVDRNYYATHPLVVARHPSETDERMMLRVLAFALNAHERLEMAPGGVSAPEEPDLWQRDLSGRIQHWIDLGQPEERRIRKACGRSDRVTLYCYGGGRALPWWQQNREALARCANLAVLQVSARQSLALAELAARTMELQCTVQDGEALCSAGERSVTVAPEIWKPLGGH
jgi:uncharacterized protein YaeQ